MKRCKCGKPIPDWAEICPECAPIRIEEVIASVFYIDEEGVQKVENFTDGSTTAYEDAIRFFNQCPSRARLVVKDPIESWRRVREK
ncbi:hypothetical protein DRO59_00855 [Candidatus Bathyarchaeota archaeon]|nr:MAG: hypothetical protein DRO59_00855 [Candidatus Bathyarchaeota archaeon]